MNGVSEELGVMSISSQLKFQDWKCNSLPFPDSMLVSGFSEIIIFKYT